VLLQVRYTLQYGAAVHRAWADKGKAPALLRIDRLRGGWLAVFMEALTPGKGWFTAPDIYKHLRRKPDPRMEAFTDDHTPGCVHGRASSRGADIRC
jgi:hypothetical protein